MAAKAAVEAGDEPLHKNLAIARAKLVEQATAMGLRVQRFTTRASTPTTRLRRG